MFSILLVYLLLQVNNHMVTSVWYYVATLIFFLTAFLLKWKKVEEKHHQQNVIIINVTAGVFSFYFPGMLVPSIIFDSCEDDEFTNMIASGPMELLMATAVKITDKQYNDGKASRLRAFSLQKPWPVLSLPSWLSITGRRKDDEADTYLRQHPEIDPPNHVAVIMVTYPVFDLYEITFSMPEIAACLTPPKDGNRRYGVQKYGSSLRGHADGATTLGNFIRWCNEEGIRVLTVYAFSTENWNRSPHEVETLMDILCRYCQNWKHEAKEHNVRIKSWTTDSDQVPDAVGKVISEAEEATTHCTGMLLNICFSYGGRHEIIRACQQIAQAVADGAINPVSIDESVFRHHLESGSTPDPDILIRTSGEYRMSNFLIFQLAYTELFFLRKYWPDIQKSDLKRVIAEYHSRQRRFGK